MTLKPPDDAPMNGQQLRTIADTIPGVLFQFYARGSGERGLYYVSGRSKELFGISGDPAMFFQKFTAGVAPEDREAFLTSIDNAVHAARKWDYTGKFIRPTGEEMYFHAISEPVSAGDELVFNGVLLDITAQEQARRAVLAGDAQYRSLVETTGTGYVILDNDSRIVTANQEYLRLCGRSTLDEIRGKPMTDWTAPYDLERNAWEVEQCLRKGQVRDLEIDYLKPDGTIQPVEINASIIPFGPSQIILTLCRDITEKKRAEEAIRASENLYRTILENTGTAIILIEEDTRISIANAEFARLSGYSREEIEGKKNWTEFIVREDLERMLAQHRLRRENHEAALTHYEFGVVTKSGEIRTISQTVEVIPGTKWSVASMMDITERKQVEIALRESEVKYRSILDNIQDTFYRSDRDGNLIMMSPSGAKLLGAASVDELLGLNIAGKIYADPDARIQLLNVMEKNGFVEDFEVDLRRKDGSVVTVSTNSHLYFDSSGELQGVEGIFRDMTERKAAEEQLKKSEHRLMDIISFLPDATVVIDKNGVVIAWNRAMEEMTGVPAGQMIGKGNYEYALPFYHERRPITIDLALHEDPAVDAKYPVMIMEGSTRIAETFIPHLNKGRGAHLWCAATPLYDAEGNLTGAIESIRDITALKQADEQLHLLLNEKEILLREIHHRVRNTIQLAVSMMKMQIRRETDKRVRNALLGTQNRLNAIASTFDMLYYSKDLSQVNLRNIIRSVVGSIQSSYVTGEHPIQSDIRIDIRELGVDLALPLALITSELVTNAFQNAFPDGRSGMVTVTGSQDEQGKITLTVNDKGPGLPEGLRPAKSGTTGLTIVHTLVQQIDGTLNYETSGKGTKFVITVPLHEKSDKSGVGET
jgi:PAS domain S-box-containing protein